MYKLYFSIVPNTVPGDTATIVDVRVDPQGKSVNVIDGTITVQAKTGTAPVAVDVITDGSVFTIWPTPPHFDADTHTLQFTGGIPGGFTTDSELFQMRITAPGAVTTNVSLANATAYLNDGKGTAETISAQPMILTTQAVTAQTSQTTSSPVVYRQSHIQWLLYGIILVLLICIVSALIYFRNKKYEK